MSKNYEKHILLQAHDLQAFKTIHARNSRTPLYMWSEGHYIYKVSVNYIVGAPKLSYYDSIAFHMIKSIRASY